MSRRPPGPFVQALVAAALVMLAAIAALLLAPAAHAAGRAPIVDRCDWTMTGRSVFTGDVPAAVEFYRDIPAATRAKLRARMERRAYDDVAEIRRSSIVGEHLYAAMTEMHFGSGTVCREVDRSRWGDAQRERGLVYCEDGHCLIVPTVCRNVSRVIRVPRTREPGPLSIAPPAFDLPLPPVEVEMRTAKSLWIDTDAPPPGGTPPPAPGEAPAQDDWRRPGDWGWAWGVVIPPRATSSLVELPAPTETFPDLGGKARPSPIGEIPAWPGSVSGGTPPAAGAPPLDAIAAPIPEPGTWAMLGAGLAVVSLVAVRRAQKERKA